MVIAIEEAAGTGSADDDRDDGGPDKGRPDAVGEAGRGDVLAHVDGCMGGVVPVGNDATVVGLSNAGMVPLPADVHDPRQEDRAAASEHGHRQVSAPGLGVSPEPGPCVERLARGVRFADASRAARETVRSMAHRILARYISVTLASWYYVRLPYCIERRGCCTRSYLGCAQ